MAIDPHDFSSDLWRVKELFRNIISNAIKYSDPKKDCSYIAIDIKINKDRAQIQIEDNGIGIEDEALPKIFDMFYRATSSAEGSGIGLYIVKNAVEKLGGKVELTSTVKLGTRFNIILPNASDNEVIK